MAQISIYPKITNYKKDRQVAPGLGTCPTPRCDSRRQAIHQFVQRQLRLLPLLVTSPAPSPSPAVTTCNPLAPQVREELASLLVTLLANDSN